MTEHSFDLILMGATGFTGRRATAYLSQHAPDTLRWGVAARNEAKLAKVAQNLGLSNEQCFVVDALNKQQVTELVQKTSIIITTVGPFSLYGEELIAACAKHGTHYFDITGEVGFIKSMTDKYEETAQKSGAILVPFSGFDSIPADLTAFLLAKKFEQPEKLSIDAYYSTHGGLNGGTIATMLNKFESGESKQMNDPHLLTGPTSQRIHKSQHAGYFGYNNELKRWTAPFIMSAINSKVVYKTAALNQAAETPYADSISYAEHFSLGKWFNPIPFISTSLTVLSLAILGPRKWFRTFLKKVMPAPGEGPSEESIEQGFFKLLAIARDENNNQHHLRMFFSGDPSNKATVFFLCESALCLHEHKDRFKSVSGFKTPAFLFGDLLVKRLTERGLHITLN